MYTIALLHNISGWIQFEYDPDESPSSHAHVLKSGRDRITNPRAMARMLRSVVCLLLFLLYARAQECNEIQISDLGSNETASTDGAIAQLISAGQAGTPDVLVISSRTVCLAAAATRDKYRFASVIATYDCGGPASAVCPPGPYPRTDQFEFRCEDPGPIWQETTLLADDRNVPVNPSITTLRRDCSFCISPDDAATLMISPTQNPVDPETHCAGNIIERHT